MEKINNSNEKQEEQYDGQNLSLINGFKIKSGKYVAHNLGDTFTKISGDDEDRMKDCMWRKSTEQEKSEYWEKVGPMMKQTNDDYNRMIEEHLHNGGSLDDFN